VKTDFIPYGPYLKVLMSLGEWKILDARKILSLGVLGVGYRDLMKKLERLEKVGLVNSITKERSKKFYYLTDMGKKFSCGTSTFGVDAEYLTHETATSSFLWELLKYPNFINGNELLLVGQNKLDPDAVVKGKINSQEYSLAIEIELTQKSIKRINEKFRRYGTQTIFDYTVYVTHNQTLLKSYQRALDLLGKKEKAQIIFLYDENLIDGKLNLNKSLCFYQNNKVNFLKLLKADMGNKRALDGHL